MQRVERDGGEAAPPGPRPARGNLSLRSVAVVGGFTLFSRLAGLLREVTKAHFLGTTMAADAFLVAFQIPNVMRSLVGEGAVSSAIVPVFSPYAGAEKRSEHTVLAEKFLTLWLALVLVITVAGVLAGGWFIETSFRWGSFADMEKVALTARLTRVLFWYLALVGMAAALQGILNAQGVFGIPSLSPALFNVTTVAWVWAASPSLEPGSRAMTFAVAVLAGGVIQAGVMVPSVWRLGVRLRLRWPFDHAAVVRVLRLLVPATYGAGIYQINSLVGTILATRLDETGVVAALGYSSRLMELVLGVFVFALSTVSLTSLSRMAAERDEAGFNATLDRVLRLVLFITLPSAVGLFLLGEPILAFLFRTGSFDDRSLEMTAGAFQYHVLALVFVGVNRSLVSAFYALGDVKTPVRTATVHLVLNLALAWGLSAGPMSYVGIAVASSASAALRTVLLVRAIRWRVPSYSWRSLRATLAKTVVASAAMGGLVGAGSLFIRVEAGWIELSCVLMPLILAGAGTFFLMAHCLGMGESRALWRRIAERFAR